MNDSYIVMLTDKAARALHQDPEAPELASFHEVLKKGGVRLSPAGPVEKLVHVFSLVCANQATMPVAGAERKVIERLAQPDMKHIVDGAFVKPPAALP